MRLATAILAEQRELQKRLVTAALAALRRLISKKSKLHLSAYTLNGGLGASRYHVLSARLHSKAGRGN